MEWGNYIMKNLGTRLITIILALLFFRSVFPMKRNHEETPKQTAEMALLSSAKKRSKIDEIKKINVKPLILKENLVQKSAYAVIHAILEGKISLKGTFEIIPAEMRGYIAGLPLILNQTLLYKVSSADDVRLLLEAGAPLTVKEDNQDVEYVDYDGITPLGALLLGGKEDAAVALLKFLDGNPDLLSMHLNSPGSEVISMTRERGLNEVFKCLMSLKSLNDEHKVSKGQKILRDQLPREGTFGLSDAEMLAHEMSDVLDSFRNGLYRLVRYPIKKMYLENIFERALGRHNFGNMPYIVSNLVKIKNYILPKAKHEKDNCDLNRLIQEGNVEAALNFVNDLDVDVDLSYQYNYFWRTPLMDAITHGYVDVASAIIERGKQKNDKTYINKQDGQGNTALRLAFKNAPGLLGKLIENGADVNYGRNDDNWCVLRLAILQYFKEFNNFAEINGQFIRFLLDNGAIVLAKDIAYFDTLTGKHGMNPELVADVRTMLSDKMQA